MGNFQNKFKSSDDNFLYDDQGLVYSDAPTIDSGKNFNISRLIIIIFLMAMLILCIILFSGRFFKQNSDNNDNLVINAPDIVYMGESIKVSVLLKDNVAVNNPVIAFSSSSDYNYYILKNEINDISENNTIVPIQEGNADLFVDLISNEESIGNSSKNIVVCPSFDKDLLHVSTVSVTKGNTYGLNIDFGESKCSSGITYDVEDKSIASINTNGVITGNKVGKTNIIIKKNDRKIVVPLIVTLTDKKPQSIETPYSKIQLLSGEKHRIVAKSMPSDATSINYSFYSSDKEIATVSSSGVIEAISPGNATITITNNENLSKKVLVVVNDMIADQASASDIKTFERKIVLKKGFSKKVFINVVPDGAINKMTTWKIVNNNVATVDQNGVVYAKGLGKAHMVITNGKISKIIDIEVTK